MTQPLELHYKTDFRFFETNHNRTAKGQLIIPIGRPESRPPVSGLGPGRLLDGFADSNGLKMANLGFRIFLNHVLNFSIFSTVQQFTSYTAIQKNLIHKKNSSEQFF